MSLKVAFFIMCAAPLYEYKAMASRHKCLVNSTVQDNIQHQLHCPYTDPDWSDCLNAEHR